jgi:GGDEF domain-containing protein
MRMSTRANRINAINETGIRMISSHHLNEVVRLATSSVAMILEADHAILRLQDEQTRRFVIRSYFGGADGHVQERLFKLDKQACVETIKRRTPVRIAELAEHEAFADWRGEFRSFLCAPLKRDGRVIGTLSVYDKIVTDHFYASAFDDDDLQIFTKFLGYVERGIESALLHGASRQQRSFDEETGLPNASYLRQRVQEEIARAGGARGAVAVAVCRIENLEEIAAQADPAHAQRVALRTAEVLRGHLRDFDVLGRTGPAELTVLLPDPGPTPGERVFDLARAVADELAKDEELNDPARIALAFGYAVHPDDGSDREALLAVAAEPRIRMV